MLWVLCTNNASVMACMRNDAEAQGLVLLSYGCFAHDINLTGKDLCRSSFCQGTLRAVVEAVVCFRRCTRARTALQSDRATHAAAGQRVGQLITFSATLWVGQSPTLPWFLANLPGLLRVLLANSHDENRFTVLATVVDSINNGTVEAAVKPLAHCLYVLF